MSYNLTAAAGGGGGGGVETVDLLLAETAQLLGTGKIPHYVNYYHTGNTTQVNRMTAQCLTFAGASTIELGIYSQALSRLASGSVAISATGLFTVSLNTTVTLTPGTVYYFVLLNQTALDNAFAAELTGIQGGIFITFQGAGAAASLPATEATQNASNRGIYISAWKA